MVYPLKVVSSGRGITQGFAGESTGESMQFDSSLGHFDHFNDAAHDGCVTKLIDGTIIKNLASGSIFLKV